MKFSEAILLGSIGSEQGFGPNSMSTNSSTKCAMGSALLAMGVVTDSESIEAIVNFWPWTRVEVKPPVHLTVHTGSPDILEKESIFGIIWRLNDFLRWTRPQIAAWVATQEAIYDVPEVTPVPVAESTLVVR